jgi:sulfonate transport system permease protein
VMKRPWKKINLIGLFLPVSIILIWLLVAETGKIPHYLLPSPKDIIFVFIDFISGGAKLSPYSGQFLDHLWTSLSRVLVGFSLATLFGLLLGFLTGWIPMAKRIIDPTANAIRTVPGIGWLPIAMVWFGVGERTTIFLIALVSFFPIYLNTAHGASSVPLLLVRAGRMLGAGKLTLFRTIVLPWAFPDVIVGLRLGLGVSWSFLVLGELTGVATGLGAVMMDSRMLGQTEMILVSMLCIAVMGFLTDRLLYWVCKLIYPVREVAAK